MKKEKVSMARIECHFKRWYLGEKRKIIKSSKFTQKKQKN